MLGQLRLRQRLSRGPLPLAAAPDHHHQRAGQQEDPPEGGRQTVVGAALLPGQALQMQDITRQALRGERTYHQPRQPAVVQALPAAPAERADHQRIHQLEQPVDHRSPADRVDPEAVEPGCDVTEQQQAEHRPDRPGQFPDSQKLAKVGQKGREGQCRGQAGQLFRPGQCLWPVHQIAVDQARQRCITAHRHRMQQQQARAEDPADQQTERHHQQDDAQGDAVVEVVALARLVQGGFGPQPRTEQQGVGTGHPGQQCRAFTGAQRDGKGRLAFLERPAFERMVAAAQQHLPAGPRRQEHLQVLQARFAKRQPALHRCRRRVGHRQAQPDGRARRNLGDCPLQRLESSLPKGRDLLDRQ